MRTLVAVVALGLVAGALTFDNSPMAKGPIGAGLDPTGHVVSLRCDAGEPPVW